MESLTAFTLAQHSGPYENWPTRTSLLFDGNATGTLLPGFIIEAQYRCEHGYLIVTSWDCPFDEMNEIALLDHHFSKLAHRCIPNYLVHAHWPVSDHELRVHFIEQIFFTISVETARGLFGRKPRLKVSKLEAPQSDPRAHASMIELSKQLDDIKTELDKSQKSNTNSAIENASRAK